jgi:hypothetical protein
MEGNDSRYVAQLMNVPQSTSFRSQAGDGLDVTLCIRAAFDQIG